MGDMADFTNDSFDWCEDEDELFGPNEGHPVHYKTCRYCGERRLVWQYVKGRWQLGYIDGSLHICPHF